MAYIPRDIFFNILSRLPVKSLARFKSLNKLCCSFITDPQFIHTHFKNGANEANDNLCLILSCEDYQHPNSIIHFFSFRDNDELAVLEYSAPVSFDSYNVLPSCNGLVCFYGLQGGVHVCNPNTKDIVRLPDIDAKGFRSLSCGFGFDEMSGNYKAIQFLEPLKAETSPVDLRIELFTMGDNSWKTIEYHSCSGFHEPPVFAGGFFYWITSCYSHAPFISIVSFDIGNEIFEEISPPESISKLHIWYNLFLVGLRGELCLVDLGERMDIWILKRNGVEKKENWVRATIVHQSEYLSYTRPVAFNGEEILLHGFIKGLGNLSCYNLETGCFRPLKIKRIPSQYFHVSPHVESLFSVQHQSM